LLLCSVPVSASPTYDYLVAGNSVQNSGGSTVYTGANMAAALTWALGHANTTTFIQAGSYTLTAAISIGSYATLINAATLTADASTHYMITATEKSHFSISGGIWNGNRAARSNVSGNDPFDFINCTNAAISSLAVINGSYDNIEFEYCQNITISGVSSGESNWDSLMLAYTSYSTVQNCLIYDSDKGGCYFYCEDDGIIQHVDHDIMENNTVERTQTSGLSISLRGAEDTGRYDLIENNNLVDCGQDGEHPGINIGWSDGGVYRWASHCTITNNTVYQSGAVDPAGVGGGINCQANDSLVYGNNIHDTQDFAILVIGDRNIISHNLINIVRTSYYTGVLMEDASHNQVIYNSITYCPYAIRVYGGLHGSVGNLIAFNHFDNESTYLISIDSGCSDTLIENNTYWPPWTISDQGTGTIIQGNTVGSYSDIFGDILTPLISAVLISMGSAYGIAGFAIGAIVLVVGVLARRWYLIVIGLAVIILTLIFVGGLLAI